MLLLLLRTCMRVGMMIYEALMRDSGGNRIAIRLKRKHASPTILRPEQYLHLPCCSAPPSPTRPCDSPLQTSTSIMTAPSLHFTQNINVASSAAAEDYVQKMFAGGAGFVKHKESGSLFDRTSGSNPLQQNPAFLID